MTDASDIQAASRWLRHLECHPRQVQLHKAQLEDTIKTCMDLIYELATNGETQRKMQLVAIEHRARLILKRWQNLDRN